MLFVIIYWFYLHNPHWISGGPGVQTSPPKLVILAPFLKKRVRIVTFICNLECSISLIRYWTQCYTRPMCLWDILWSIFATRMWHILLLLFYCISLSFVLAMCHTFFYREWHPTQHNLALPWGSCTARKAF